MRFIQSLVICLLLLSGLSHAANNYQDWWWNPAQSGMGLNVGQQNDTIFVAWFNYGDDTKASFLTMGDVLNGNTLTGTLYRGTGPVPGPNYNPAQVKQTAVGTATLNFNTNNDATLTYSYDNKGGTMALQRFSFAEPNFNQTWTVIDAYTNTDCVNSSMNGSVTKAQSIRSQKGTGSNFTFTINDLDGANMCIAAMSFQPAGSRGIATGTAACEGGFGAKITFDDLSIQANYLNFSYTVTGMNSDRSCIQKGTMSGVVKKENPPTYDLKAAVQNRLLKGASKTFNVTGDCKGTFSMTDSPATQTSLKGKPVYAVSSIQVANLPNCTLGVSNQSFITYYDMNFLEVAQFNSTAGYSEFVSAIHPTTVKVGDAGTLGTWYHWYDENKSINWGSNVRSYIVEPGTSSYVILNVIDRNYSNESQLISTSQLRYQLSDAGNLEMISATSDFSNKTGHLVLQ